MRALKIGAVLFEIACRPVRKQAGKIGAWQQQVAGAALRAQAVAQYIQKHLRGSAFRGGVEGGQAQWFPQEAEGVAVLAVLPKQLCESAVLRQAETALVLPEHETQRPQRRGQWCGFQLEAAGNGELQRQAQ